MGAQQSDGRRGVLISFDQIPGTGVVSITVLLAWSSAYDNCASDSIKSGTRSINMLTSTKGQYTSRGGATESR